MNLDWYRGLEPILRIDPRFSADHVTAYRLKTVKDVQKPSKKVNNNAGKEDFMLHNGFKKRIPSQNTEPHMSRQFTPHVIIKSLKQTFKSSWLSYINTSSKLEFYKQVKSEFTKENYLDIVQNYFERVSLTRLRISAHRLEIEIGRRNETPRVERTCTWCDLSLGADVIENEIHFLDHCDLNASIRQAYLDKLTHLQTSTITSSSNNIQHMNQLSERLSISDEIQTHIIRVTARFISNSFKNREKFLNSMKNQ